MVLAFSLPIICKQEEGYFHKTYKLQERQAVEFEKQYKLLEVQLKMEETNTLKIFTDGGSRGNPGPSALGFYVESDSGATLDEVGTYLGVTTNNIAEYSAIVAALNWILVHKLEMPNLKRVEFFMDSQLAASQLNGLYRIKNSKLRELLFEARQKESEIGLPVTYSHVPREQNKKADRMVNVALDNNLN